MLDANTANLLNILRVAASVAILGYSCVTDWKIRRAPNRLWYLLGGVGLVLGGLELYLSGFDRTYIVFWILSIVFIFVIVYFLYYFFQYFGMAGLGGADAKALIAIAIMFPYYPHHIGILGWSLPVAYNVRSLVFGLAVFGNALALNLVLPAGLLVRNLLSVPVGELAASPLSALTGYKADVEAIKGKHVRLMSRYSEEDGRLTIRRALGGTELDDATYQNLLRWKGEGKIDGQVWVTPKVPFLIPITLGLLVAVAYGDILTQIIGFFIYH